MPNTKIGECQIGDTRIEVIKKDDGNAQLIIHYGAFQIPINPTKEELDAAINLLIKAA